MRISCDGRNVRLGGSGFKINSVKLTCSASRQNGIISMQLVPSFII